MNHKHIRLRYLKARYGLRYGLAQLRKPAYPMRGIPDTDYQVWIDKLQEQYDILYKYRESTENLELSLPEAESILKEYRAKARYNKPPKRKEFIDYLKSHDEREHIELDLQERYGHSDLNKLTHNQLHCIAQNYNYYKGDENAYL